VRRLPGRAVIGGAPVDPASVPSFAYVGVCGGTLVAPDRVVIAAHCIADRTLPAVPVSAGGVYRRPTQYALHPGWSRRNGENFRDDVAIVQLDAPVTGVAPATGARARSTPPTAAAR
jgi:hypothetical protein